MGAFLYITTSQNKALLVYETASINIETRHSPSVLNKAGQSIELNYEFGRYMTATVVENKEISSRHQN